MIYHIDRVIRETVGAAENGVHEIYVKSTSNCWWQFRGKELSLTPRRVRKRAKGKKRKEEEERRRVGGGEESEEREEAGRERKGRKRGKGKESRERREKERKIKKQEADK